MTACSHGMPSPASCWDCMQDEGLGAPPVEPVTVEATFSARFPGECGGCNLPVSEGQRIAKLSSGAYVHVGCVP